VEKVVFSLRGLPIVFQRSKWPKSSLEDVIYQYKKFNTGDANYATQLAAYNTEVTNLLADITTLSALSLPALT
jgi:hypothetical protein